MTTKMTIEKLTEMQTRFAAATKKEAVIALAIELGLVKHKTEGKATQVDALRGMVANKLTELYEEHIEPMDLEDSTTAASDHVAQITRERLAAVEKGEAEPVHVLPEDEFAAALSQPVSEPQAQAMFQVTWPSSSPAPTEVAWARAELLAVKPLLPGLLAWARENGEDASDIVKVERMMNEFRVSSLDTLAREVTDGGTVHAAFLSTLLMLDRRTKAQAANVANDRGMPYAPAKRFGSGATTAAEFHRAQARRRVKNQRKHKRAHARRRHA